MVGVGVGKRTGSLERGDTLVVAVAVAVVCQAGTGLRCACLGGFQRPVRLPFHRLHRNCEEGQKPRKEQNFGPCIE
jgi:hypothetical protein